MITANGDILWEQVDAGATSENWTQVTHTGDTWTEINAGTSSETWTNKVVLNGKYLLPQTQGLKNQVLENRLVGGELL